MCNQAVGLVGAELERQGIASVAIQLLREVAEKVRPPRSLLVPFRHGRPLDRPGDPRRQHAVIESALRMLEDPALEVPALVEFVPGNGDHAPPDKEMAADATLESARPAGRSGNAPG